MYRVLNQCERVEPMARKSRPALTSSEVMPKHERFCSPVSMQWIWLVILLLY